MNFKRITALSLATAMSLSSFASVTSFGAETVDEKGKALYDLGLFQGYSKDEIKLGLADSLTREQAIKLTLTFLGYGEGDLDKEAKSPFTDVKSGTKWAEPWVKFAADLGITSGISDTEFGYGQPVTKHQLTTFMLRALGYEDAWSKASDLGLELDLITAKDITEFSQASLRGDFADIGYETLKAAVVGKDTSLIQKLVDANKVDEQTAEKLGLIKEENVQFEVKSIKALNLAETEVTFTKALSDKATEKEQFSNFRVNGKSIKGIKKVDDETIILFHNAIENSKTVKVEIKDVKDTADTKLAKKTEEVRYLDTELPTLVGSEVVGFKTIRLTFSEAMKDKDGSFDKNAFAIYKENGSKVYIREAKVAGDNNRQIDLTLLSSLEEQEYTVQIKASLTDYAGFGLVDKTTVDVKKDTEAPQVVDYKNVSETGITLIFNEDIKESSANKDAFYHTNTKNKVDSYEINGKELKLTFTSNPLPQGIAYIFIKEKSLKDLWENKVEDIRTSIEVTVDEEAPIVESIKQGTENNQIIITFKEADLDETQAEKRANYTVKKADGKEVTVRSAVMNKEKVTITLKDNVSGDLTVTIENLKDTHNNKMDKEEFTLSFVDKDAPKFPGEVTRFNTPDEYILRLKFDDTGRMADSGQYSVLDETKYQITYNGNITKDFEDIDNAEVRLLDDGVSVELVIPRDSLKNFSSFNAVGVARVADIDGNVTSQLVKKYAANEIVIASNVAVSKAEATGKNKIKVTLDERLDTIEFEDFDITRNSQSINVGSTEVSLDKDGNTVLEFTMEDEFGAEATGLQFIVAKQQSVTGYGVRLARGTTTVADKVAPAYEKDATKTANTNLDQSGKLAGFVLVFDEKLNPDSRDFATTDFVVTDEDQGKTLVAGIDYRVLISLEEVKFILAGKYAKDDNFTVEVKDANYVADFAGNKVQDFTATIDRQLTSAQRDAIGNFEGLPGRTFATQDTIIRNGSYSNLVHDHVKELIVKRDASGFTRETLMQFENVPFDAIKAELHFFVTRKGQPESRYRIEYLGGAVDEKVTKWNNAPRIVGTLADNIKIDEAGRWYTVDITNYINSNANNSESLAIVIKNIARAGSDSISYIADRESDKGAYISYTIDKDSK